LTKIYKPKRVLSLYKKKIYYCKAMMIKNKKYIAFNQKFKIDQFIKLRKIMRRDKNMKSRMTFINNRKN
jgi:hypothetical protein